MIYSFCYMSKKYICIYTYQEILHLSLFLRFFFALAYRLFAFFDNFLF